MVMSEFLLGVLCYYFVDYLDVMIDMQEWLSFDIVCVVQEGMIDIGIVVGDVCIDGLQVMLYWCDCFVFVIVFGYLFVGLVLMLFVVMFDYDFIGLFEVSVIYVFLKCVVVDVQCMLCWCIQVSNFEIVCWMIEVNVGVGVLFEGIVCCYVKMMVLCFVVFEDDWVECQLQICVVDFDVLLCFVCDFVDLFVEDVCGQFD